MATVFWQDQVVVLGGCNEEEKALNDVFMYDCHTGKITALPSIKPGMEQLLKFYLPQENMCKFDT